MMNATDIKAEVSFMKIGSRDLTIEGVIFIPGEPDCSGLEIYLYITEDCMIPCKTYRVRLRDQVIDGRVVTSAIGFVGTVVDYLQHSVLKIGIFLHYNNKKIDDVPIITGRFFPVSTEFKHAYAYQNGYVFFVTDHSICAVRVGLAERVKREFLFLKELLCINKPYNIKAVAARCFYHVAGVFKRKELWLISDRINKADDNGEAFFKYLNEKEVPENLYFIIRKDSADYADIKKYGKVIEYNSIKRLLYHLSADAVITANGDYILNPFGRYAVYFADILNNQKRIYLRHGVGQNNQTEWLNKFNQNFSMIVATAIPEYESFLTQEYYYNENTIKLTGFARYDRLFDDRKKIITIMPTWRQYLIDDSKASDYREDGKHHYNQEYFMNTDYYRFYNSLLNDTCLLQKTEELGYIIQFMPHPNIIPYIDWFPKNEKVRFCSVETKYRQVFAESALVVTDYSSVAFDFAYLRKPVLYCQFDKEEFFSKHLFAEGYFDYERDGFGEVSYNLKDTVDHIIEYMEHDCVLKDKYRDRINRFFAFHDKNNCQRIYEAIKSLG